jgi:hypothetical protein
LSDSISKRRGERGRRAELQRLVGDRAVILPRVMHGTPARPAQGWYAVLANGEDLFLGDYGALAAVAIHEHFPDP